MVTMACSGLQVRFVVRQELFDSLRYQPGHRALGIERVRLRADCLQAFDQLAIDANRCQVFRHDAVIIAETGRRVNTDDLHAHSTSVAMLHITQAFTLHRITSGQYRGTIDLNRFSVHTVIRQ
jgi:hypothetical protein